jgi:hypothetical protein
VGNNPISGREMLIPNSRSHIQHFDSEKFGIRKSVLNAALNTT